MEKKSQVWIETAVYILIGLTIIAILLAVAVPQIDKMKDQSILKQTALVLNQIDAKITETKDGRGSIRIVDFTIGKGKLEINANNNSLIYSLENTNLEFSEPGVTFMEGNIKILTQPSGRKFNIYLTMEYNQLNITYNEKEETKILQAGSAPYKMQIKNIGDNQINQKSHIDFYML